MPSMFYFMPIVFCFYVYCKLFRNFYTRINCDIACRSLKHPLYFSLQILSHKHSPTTFMLTNYFFLPFMSLHKQFDFSIFTGKKIAINERNHLNADFLLKDIIYYFKDAQIISFYNTKDYYKEITKNAQSYIENKNIVQSEVQIIDDYFTARRMEYTANGNTIFYVFRSNSFAGKDLYLADYIIDLFPLKSGVCKEIDGNIRIYERERVIYESKYKVTRNCEVKMIL